MKMDQAMVTESDVLNLNNNETKVPPGKEGPSTTSSWSCEAHN